jgi:putative N6-adenine-specific DNA methylase
VKSTQKQNQLSVFAVTAPGLEKICAAELSALGIRAQVEEGGVAWSGDLESVARANLWLRTASRVLVRVAEFRATAFFELELNAKKVEWAKYVAAKTTVEFRVTCRKSKLYHSDAVAQRFTDAMTRAVRGVQVAKPSANDDDDADESPHQLFVVRFLHDVCTVSVDTSGALLHRRGYRQQLAKAPLRETLAAAMLLAADWDGTTPLSDPMCGSGTIAIEAAMIARRIAPGLGGANTGSDASTATRDFAFRNWPKFDQTIWTKLVADARAQELAAAPVRIEAFDRDAGAIDAARANAARAGVTSDIEFGVQPISALPDASALEPGVVAVNPPYGIRVGEADRLRNLYAQLGNVLRKHRAGWRLALLSADRKLEQQTALDLSPVLSTKNGGIPVRLMVALVGTESAPAPTAAVAPH